MTEEWVHLPNQWTHLQRFSHMIEQLQESFGVLPELESAESRRARAAELVKRRDALAGKLWNVMATREGGLSGTAAVRAASAADDESTQQVVGELVSLIPTRVIHERKNAWAYLDAEVQQPVIDAGPLADSEVWRDRADAANIDALDRLGNPEDYDGAEPIEDIAVPPDVAWTEADRKAALDNAVDTYGLEPGEWYSMEWPPTEASLWSAGSVSRTEWEPCSAHEDDPDSDEAETCVTCEDSVRETVVAEALWVFTVALTKNRIGFDISGTLVDDLISEEIDSSFEVREIEQDPREILIGSPGRGTRW
ncbi:hypothetical protein GIY30_09280 [Gordonia sp. HNM0687]|uniref:Uncharacterized protein n=1 Tax=Gordonia mangrovi TaxID=2665643 RepID=A0A6L7GQQ2_9ACTN|nr:hypothetical protein [Gordonia mangrovi]MXP21541.1 hypothetical protein [Gordonia mangrovi]UVF80284.1 hypothetical protein NWF22_10875 [Gordonia mangrovi]